MILGRGNGTFHLPFTRQVPGSSNPSLHGAGHYVRWELTRQTDTRINVLPSRSGKGLVRSDYGRTKSWWSLQLFTYYDPLFNSWYVCRPGDSPTSPWNETPNYDALTQSLPTLTTGPYDRRPGDFYTYHLCRTWSVRPYKSVSPCVGEGWSCVPC